MNALLRPLLDSSATCIDVRSPGEVAREALPGFINAPILNNEERHQVGLCYKQHGQGAAIALGHQLVAASKEARIDQWVELLRPSSATYLMCWRGGLRSKTASQWLSERAIAHEVIPGGYKAIRHLLLSALAEPVSLIVLAGLTGAGKTDLLHAVDWPAIDFERLAHHRGSSFGGFLQTEQPAQATFENALAVALLKLRGERPLLVEDESRAIGSCILPDAIFTCKSTAPVIWLEEPIHERARRIYAEYVSAPLKRFAPNKVQEHLEKSLLKIERKLGGQMTAEILSDLRQAFSETLAFEAHHPWIEKLLVHYYDKLYLRCWEQNTRKVIFRGSWQECKEWIQTSN